MRKCCTWLLCCCCSPSKLCQRGCHGPCSNLYAAAGVLGNVLLPDWLQTALLTVLLLVVVYKTAGKAQKQSAVERKARCSLTQYLFAAVPRGLDACQLWCLSCC